jgi:hypothetical protein
MEKEKVVSAVVGGIVAGFSIGVGFMIAQKTMGRWVNRKAEQEKETISDAVQKGVAQGVQQANFNSMNGQQMKRRTSNYMGFDGENTQTEWSESKSTSDPMAMSHSSDPLTMGSPNSSLNVW